MNLRFTVVETTLNRAEFRWKWLRFLRHSFVLGIILCLLVLLFGGAIAFGWITSKTLATTFFGVLATKAPPPPFPATPVLAHLLIFIGALTATILVYELNSPWERLVAANKANRVEPVRAEKPLELALPATNSLEQDVSWGDVRI